MRSPPIWRSAATVGGTRHVEVPGLRDELRGCRWCARHRQPGHPGSGSRHCRARPACAPRPRSRPRQRRQSRGSGRSPRRWSGCPRFSRTAVSRSRIDPPEWSTSPPPAISTGRRALRGPDVAAGIDRPAEGTDALVPWTRAATHRGARR